MTGLAQPAWKGRQDDPQGWIQDAYDFSIPSGLSDISTEPGSSENMIFVLGTIHIRAASEVQRQRFKLNMILEDGQWTWNPISGLRREDL